MVEALHAVHVCVCLLGLACLWPVQQYTAGGKVEEEEEEVTGGMEFCYVNDFDALGVHFTPLLVEAEATLESVTRAVDEGRPFVVGGVTRGWAATGKWSHSHFKELFKDSQLFSSTFSTAKAPRFGDKDTQTYFGIFLNDPALAELVAMDYSYPDFIPPGWRVRGNEWLHWGLPPCGAKRHMDLMCTSRVSVQVRGRKKWRLYPLLNEGELASKNLQNWSSVLKPLEVELEPGNALVWFPGWEHETRITSGPSISVSLHFSSPEHSVYQQTFTRELGERVQHHCQWSSSSSSSRQGDSSSSSSFKQ